MRQSAFGFDPASIHPASWSMVSIGGSFASCGFAVLKRSPFLPAARQASRRFVAHHLLAARFRAKKVLLAEG